MCGIAALFSPLLRSDGEGLVHKMVTSVAHRGPDAQAVVRVDAQAVLGHARLAIIDLSSAGRQPMSDEPGRYWLTYNGEIYNYLELREELEALGVRFVSSTDSEVVLRAYIQWGEACLHRFNGMFGFAIYDAKTKRAFLARDRFGVKPLYYWRDQYGHLAIASEIKQFAALPNWSPRINGQRVYDFLRWAIQDHTDETLFDGVMQLFAGECMDVDCRGDRVVGTKRRWYELKASEPCETFAKSAERFEALLRDAVTLRLRSDVPMGSCLSGGLDSSAIVCLMHLTLRAGQMRTFSACSRWEQFDERPYAEMVVKQTNAQGTFIYPDEETLFRELHSVIWHQDEPFPTTSIFGQWSVFGAAAKGGVKVMLDGQGADEQLAGYSGYQSARLLDLLRQLRLASLMRELSQQGSHVWKGLAASFVPSWCLSMRDKRRYSWIDADYLGAATDCPVRVSGSSPGRVEQLLNLHFAKTLPKLLHYEDRNSMAHSIESRTPFLDYRLVEFLQAVPAEWKIAQGESKRILRAGLKGVLPEAIRTRRDKLGFATPEERWVRERSPDLFRRKVREAVDLGGGVLREDARLLCDAIIDGRRPYNPLLWRIICFGEWVKVFSVKP